MDRLEETMTPAQREAFEKRMEEERTGPSDGNVATGKAMAEELVKGAMGAGIAPENMTMDEAEKLAEDLGAEIDALPDGEPMTFGGEPMIFDEMGDPTLIPNPEDRPDTAPAGEVPVEQPWLKVLKVGEVLKIKGISCEVVATKGRGLALSLLTAKEARDMHYDAIDPNRSQRRYYLADLKRQKKRAKQIKAKKRAQERRARTRGKK